MALITVRPAVQGDIDALARAHIRSWQHGYRGILSDQFLDNMPLTPKLQRWLEILDDPNHAAWVAESDETLIGFASVAPSRDVDLDPHDWSELVRLYLLPEAWGTGAAQALTGECLDQTKQYFLWVLSDNHRAQAFYRKLGFAPDGKDQPITIADRTVQELRMRRPAQAETESA